MLSGESVKDKEQRPPEGGGSPPPPEERETRGGIPPERMEELASRKPFVSPFNPMRLLIPRTARGQQKLAASEIAFGRILKVAGWAVLGLLVGIFITLVVHSMPAIKQLGAGFLYGTTWNPVTGELGALPFILGTLLTSFLALAISLPFSLAISIYLGEYFREGPVSSFLKSAVDLLAGIPSVIYGFWGLFVLVPVVRTIQMKLGIPPYGVGIFTASVVLAVMIIPYSASLGREVIQLVPSDQKEAALSLGATRYEVIRRVVLPYARSGILAGVLLALGRALGETMAVTMVIGNSNFLPKSVFSPANTMASVIANEFAEATEAVYLSALVEVGLILFLVSTVISIVGRHIIKRTSVEIA
jgi:phosphate transport system permease protein